MSFARQRLAMRWVRNAFGDFNATDPIECGARCVEEAIELAQAVGVSKEVVGRITDRVFSRPPGDIRQEIGGTGFTLDVLAESMGVNAELEIEKEINRVWALPLEPFRAKHADKVRAGTSAQ